MISGCTGEEREKDQGQIRKSADVDEKCHQLLRGQPHKLPQRMPMTYYSSSLNSTRDAISAVQMVLLLAGCFWLDPKHTHTDSDSDTHTDTHTDTDRATKPRFQFKFPEAISTSTTSYTMP